MTRKDKQRIIGRPIKTGIKVLVLVVMLYQATYMNAHPDSRFAPLADNVLHPFHEYLLVMTEHRFAGLGLLLLFGILVFRAYRREPNDDKLSAMMSLLALSVFSFFSYLFKYQL